MSSDMTSIDISNIPDLLNLVEDVEATQKPRELRRNNKSVALLTPIIENKAKWEKIKEAFGSWSDIDTDKLIENIQRWRAEGSRPATRP
jgi:hypothetical protein